MSITLPRPLYLNADKTKIVEEGSPDARFVLGGAGSEINDADAKLYGLEEYLKKTKPLDQGKATVPEQNKALIPPGDKALLPKSNKDTVELKRP